MSQLHLDYFHNNITCFFIVRTKPSCPCGKHGRKSISLHAELVRQCAIQCARAVFSNLSSMEEPPPVNAYRPKREKEIWQCMDSTSILPIAGQISSDIWRDTWNFVGILKFLCMHATISCKIPLFRGALVGKCCSVGCFMCVVTSNA